MPVVTEDIAFGNPGVDVFLPKSRIGQAAAGRSVAVLKAQALKPADRLGA